MKEFAIKIQQLSFNYSNQKDIFFDLNLNIKQGERFGLFGPNGAGKTTLMNLMTGLLSYKNGGIELFGNLIKTKNKNINKLFGLVPQDFSFYEELSPKENLEFFGAWYGMNRITVQKKSAELFKILHLDQVRNKAIKKFSGGMKRKVNLAIGVIHQPEILFLDEPTVGVDVQTRHEIINYLKELNARGTTLVYTSHQLNEAEELCDKIALIDNGKIIAHDSIDNLKTIYNKNGLESLFIDLTGKSFDN